MTQKHPLPPESQDVKAGGSESPMENFSKLAKNIVGVTPEQLKVEQDRYEERNDGKKRPKLKLRSS